MDCWWPHGSQAKARREPLRSLAGPGPAVNDAVDGFRLALHAAPGGCASALARDAERLRGL